MISLNIKSRKNPLQIMPEAVLKGLNPKTLTLISPKTPVILSIRDPSCMMKKEKVTANCGKIADMNLSSLWETFESASRVIKEKQSMNGN